jgi:predicted small lipoprotein YifL
MDNNTTIVGKLGLGRIQRPGLSALTAVVCNLALLTGCGQKGGLYLPTDPAARNRATLPQTVLPIPSSSNAGTATITLPAAPASAAP